MSALALVVTAWVIGTMPNPQMTPGMTNSDVTEATLSSTICVRGWTRTVRPPVAYTTALKRRQIAEYGYADRRLGSYEEDHLIPLELGGSPTDPRNLWPQPRHTVDGWDAGRKDDLENELNRLVCEGTVGLQEAQQAIATDWIAAYRRYMGEP